MLLVWTPPTLFYIPVPYVSLKGQMQPSAEKDLQATPQSINLLELRCFILASHIYLCTTHLLTPPPN